uniref:IPT/TIG domain-containing protein n=1 Tax=Parastrongyloides trichosuri TaxID=131310 RepID=A0A0N4ZLZ6_PARTI
KCHGRECTGAFSTSLKGKFMCRGEAHNPKEVKVEVFHPSGFSKEYGEDIVKVKNGSFFFNKTFVPHSGLTNIYLKMTIDAFCCENSVESNCNEKWEIRLPDSVLSCGHSSSTFDMETMELGFHNYPKVYCSNPTMFSNN